ncbi:hypothetical protein PDESU_05516 [Pontiella desulfatans]|uniref:Uncharacterized protein n=1 Tax=Pontiella desulfatans TaxID=2750659 RepID=A0A6C2UC46_PONDE|nr:hypothetical protein [Pontiella desulfatans]VGO16924.1 hypothetical protein PDESU_05516 [Pontiella desulfatans]
MSENYIRKYAARVLTYKDLVAKYAGSDALALSPGRKTFQQVFREVEISLTKPRLPWDATEVFEELEQLLQSSAYDWNKEVEIYVSSIFPSVPPTCPNEDGDGARVAHSVGAGRAFTLAKQMVQLDYMFTKPPKKWREWNLLTPTAYNAVATEDAVRSLIEDHGKYLLPFCDGKGCLHAPSYNELLGYMEFELSANSSDVHLQKEALFKAVSVFQEYGLYCIRLGEKSEWDRDFFRFERPDLINGRTVVGVTGTVRIVMPSGYAGVGLKNHFPHEAYRVVCAQVNSVTGIEKAATKSGKLSDDQLLEVVNIVYRSLEGRDSKLRKSQVIRELDAVSNEMWKKTVSSSSIPEVRTRQYCVRLRRIDARYEQAFKAWLSKLKHG